MALTGAADRMTITISSVNGNENGACVLTLIAQPVPCHFCACTTLLHQLRLPHTCVSF